MRVTPPEGVELTDVVSDVDARGEHGSVVLKVPDLLADEIRHLHPAGRADIGERFEEKLLSHFQTYGR